MQNETINESSTPAASSVGPHVRNVTGMKGFPFLTEARSYLAYRVTRKIARSLGQSLFRMFWTAGMVQNPNDVGILLNPVGYQGKLRFGPIVEPCCFYPAFLPFVPTLAYFS